MADHFEEIINIFKSLSYSESHSSRPAEIQA